MATLDDVLDPVDVALDMGTWAVVGATPDLSRPSGFVTRALVDDGYDVVPVNPAYDEVLGIRCVPDLASVGRPVDVVDLFRRRSQVAPHVEEAIAVGARAVWFQVGTTDPVSADRARAAGLVVVEDRCPKVELPRRRGRHRR